MTGKKNQRIAVLENQVRDLQRKLEMQDIEINILSRKVDIKIPTLPGPLEYVPTFHRWGWYPGIQDTYTITDKTTPNTISYN